MGQEGCGGRAWILGSKRVEATASFDRSDSRNVSYVPVGKWRQLMDWGTGKERMQGVGPQGEVMGEDGQSGWDALCETAGLSLKMGGQTKLSDPVDREVVLRGPGMSRPGPFPTDC